MTELLDTLPFEGGWAEQPDLIISAIAILKSEQNRIDNEGVGNDTGTNSA